MVFREAQDAYLVFDLLAQRFAEFGLKLHPDKTRLIHFRPPPWGPSGKDRLAPRSFDFLGFNNHWGRSRKGAWVVKQKTARSRFTRTMHRISEWCRRNRHRPIAEQHEYLVRQLRGHDGYFGVIGNMHALARLRYEVMTVWRWWLSRRSRTAGMNWDRFLALLKRYPLPPPKLYPVVCPA